MPDLTGQTCTSALRILRSMGAGRVEITYVENAGPLHAVLGHRPSAGEEIGDPIGLEVEGRNPIRHLPGIYRRADRAEGGFLRRMLWPFAHLLMDLDRQLREVPTLLDPATAPEGFLPWLRRLVAMPLDGGREIILRAPDLWQRKGTARGILDGLRLLLGIEAELRDGVYSLSPWWLGPGAIVGESRLHRRGASLPAAFEILLPVSRNDLGPGRVRRLRHVLGLLKPAHTVCRLRFSEERPRRLPSLRIGVTRLEDHHGGP